MKLIIRKSSVRWKAGAIGGSRRAIVKKGALNQARFSLSKPRVSDSYTYPAELIAAAYSNGFSLALSNELKLDSCKRGMIVITVTVTLQRVASIWTIMNIHLHVEATLPTMTQRRFINSTVRAKARSLVSALAPTKISMSAKLAK